MKDTRADRFADFGRFDAVCGNSPRTHFEHHADHKNYHHGYQSARKGLQELEKAIDAAIDEAIDEAFTDGDTGIDGLVKQRGSRYGSMGDNSRIVEGLTDVLRTAPNWGKLTPSQREAAHMICLKLARAACGDGTYDDNWVDIAGYATLIVKELKGGGA